MKKSIHSKILCGFFLVTGTSYAGVTIDKDFTLSVMDTNEAKCQITFSPGDDGLKASTGDNGDNGCKIEGDMNSGFTVTMNPAAKKDESNTNNNGDNDDNIDEGDS